MTQRKIIIVDDDPAIRSLLLRAFKPDYSVCVAGSGEEAIQASRDEKFDVGFIDMRMPGMDGLETFRALKEMNPGLTAYIVTGYADQERIDMALQEGVVGCIQKPFNISDLKKIIDGAHPLEGKKSIHILAIDNDPAICSLFGQLERLGDYIVKTFQDPELALEALSTEPYDVVFLDVVLGGKDGIVLGQKIHDVSPKTKIILITGFVEKEAAMNREVGKGVAHGLKKPLDMWMIKSLLTQMENQS